MNKLLLENLEERETSKLNSKRRIDRRESFLYDTFFSRSNRIFQQSSPVIHAFYLPTALSPIQPRFHLLNGGKSLARVTSYRLYISSHALIIRFVRFVQPFIKYVNRVNFHFFLFFYTVYRAPFAKRSPSEPNVYWPDISTFDS